jgi:hypothetical protein
MVIGGFGQDEPLEVLRDFSAGMFPEEKFLSLRPLLPLSLDFRLVNSPRLQSLLSARDQLRHAGRANRKCFLDVEET